MVGSRTVTALAGVVGSLLVTGVLYYYTGQLLVFLAVPFVPLLLRRRGESDGEERTCPTCGYTTDADHAYCPRDGTKLE